MALAVPRPSPCTPLAIPVLSETAVGVEREAINADPVSPRTVASWRSHSASAYE